MSAEPDLREEVSEEWYKPEYIILDCLRTLLLMLLATMRRVTELLRFGDCVEPAELFLAASEPGFRFSRHI